MWSVVGDIHILVPCSKGAYKESKPKPKPNKRQSDSGGQGTRPQYCTTELTWVHASGEADPRREVSRHLLGRNSSKCKPNSCLKALRADLEASGCLD